MSSQHELQELSDEEESDDVFPPSLGAIHGNGCINGVALLHSNAPSHADNPDEFLLEPDGDSDDDSMMASLTAEEYERRIQSLEQTNAILRQNMAALYAENAARVIQPSEMRDSRSNIHRLTHMELSQDEAYLTTPIPHSDQLTLTEGQNLHTIRTLQKTNAKLQSKLDRQKMLVSQLSANLKLAADKIQHLMQSNIGNNHSNVSDRAAFGCQDRESERRQRQHVAIAQGESVSEIHQYQIQVIRNEILSILHLMTRNSTEHDKNAARLLAQNQNVDIPEQNTGATSGLRRDTFADRLQRVISQLRGEHISISVDCMEDRLSTSRTEKKASNCTNESMSESTTTNDGKQEEPRNTLFPSAQVVYASSIDEMMRSTEAVVQPSSRLEDESVHRTKEVDQQSMEATNSVTPTDKSSINWKLAQHQPHFIVIQGGTYDLGTTKIEGIIDVDRTSTIVDEEFLNLNDGFSHTNGNEISSIGMEEGLLCEPNRGVNRVISLVGESECFRDAMKEDPLDGTDDSNNAENQVLTEVQFNDHGSQGSDSSMPLYSLEGYAISSGTDARDNKLNGKHHYDRKQMAVYDPSSGLENDKLSVLVADLDADIVSHDKSGFGSSKNSLQTPQANRLDSDIPDSSEIMSPNIFGYVISDLVPSKSLSFEAGETPIWEATDNSPIQNTSTQHKRIADSTSSNEVTLKSTNKNNSIVNMHGMKRSSLSGSTIQTWDMVMRRKRSAILRSTKLDSENYSALRLSRRQLFQQPKTSTSANRDESNGLKQRSSVLVCATNGVDYIPPSAPPTLPPMNNQTAPVFKKGLKDGFYIYKSSTGNEYSGDWKDGKRHGFGIAKYRDGEVYCGQWRSGRRHGIGTLHLANTEVFDGAWDSNKKHGIGTYFWADGDVDVSWYEHDVRLESIRWSKDRLSSYRLDLQSSKKNRISLQQATQIVMDWERRGEPLDGYPV
ncbi:hypothetical protein HJC23_003743 [Cyclotella cryptica]|uniref:Uncharacterized protein n=1 Tax=Cyclotella cryptica TaxID=29204 RepID=A0ABD3QTW6_9STRA|eukprot:CCRYP_002147-RA/>CCRYP_002147-RA protein AED:0.04 eAED:0.04 QI:162/1/1/1/0.5/0.4/5/1100/951